MENYNIGNQETNTSQKEFERKEAYLRAKEKVKKLKGFYWHLAAYITVNIFIITTNAINQGDSNIFYFGTFSTAFFWGIGLAFHAMGVFGKDLLFGKQWENRKVQEFMDEDKKRWE